jgi:hypothetical protein
MKKTFMVTLICISASGWAMAAYQNSVMRRNSSVLEGRIMQQVRQLWDTYYSVRDEFDTKERTKLYVAQQEQQRLMEEALFEQMTSLRNAGLKLQKRAEEETQSIRDTVRDIEGKIQERQEGFEKKLAVAEEGFGVCRGDIVRVDAAVSALDKKSGEQMAAIQESVTAQGRIAQSSLEGYGRILAVQKASIDNLARQQEDLRVQIREVKGVLEQVAGAKNDKGPAK